LDAQLTQGVPTALDLARVGMSESCSCLFKQVDCASDRLATSIAEIVVPFNKLIGGDHICRHSSTMT
jgi:hypothetical protein